MAEIPLASTFQDRAAGFMQSAVLALDRFGVDYAETILHSTCCALELSLKAIILNGGGSDARNRAVIRHDLTKALDAAASTGFNPSPHFRPLVALLTRPYATHALIDLGRSITAARLAEIVAISEAEILQMRQFLPTTRRELAFPSRD